MREIKFRAYHKELKILFPVSEISFKIDATINYVKSFDRNSMGFELFGHGVDIELMQYTGLHDKNGKEGCHKDIVNMYDFLFTIEWCDKSCKFHLKSNGVNNIKYAMSHFTEHGVIIGNLYENPEFLNYTVHDLIEKNKGANQ